MGHRRFYTNMSTQPTTTVTRYTERLSPPQQEQWQSYSDFRDQSFGQQATPAGVDLVYETQIRSMEQQLRTMEQQLMATSQALSESDAARSSAEQERLAIEDFCTTQTVKFNESMVRRNGELDEATQQTAELVARNTELEASYAELVARNTELETSYAELQFKHDKLQSTHQEAVQIGLRVARQLKDLQKPKELIWSDALQHVFLFLCFIYTVCSLVGCGVGPYADAFVSRSILHCFTVLASVTWFFWVTSHSS